MVLLSTLHAAIGFNAAGSALPKRDSGPQRGLAHTLLVSMEEGAVAHEVQASKVADGL